MKKLKMILLVPFLGTFFNFQAQLQDGVVAPDFNLPDLNGQNYSLYSYLDQGKTVFLDFFACHCSFCWNYHNTHAMNDLYIQHGIDAPNDSIVVLGIELDANNGINEFSGVSGSTQGNWLAGTNYPLLNPEGTLRSQIIQDYNVTFYPLIYAICPDRTIRYVGKQGTDLLYAHHVNNCATDIASIQEAQANQLDVLIQTDGNIHVDLKNENLIGSTLKVRNMLGKIIQTEKIEITISSISIESLHSGLYFIQIIDPSNNQLFNQKIIK